MDITTFTNFNSSNPFEEELVASTSKVHLRLTPRKGRKYITLITGLDDDVDLPALNKALKKALSCNGTVLEDRVLQLSGDQRAAVAMFLVDGGYSTRDRIRT